MIRSLHLNKRLLGFLKLPKTFKLVEVRPNDVHFCAPAAPRADRASAEEPAEEPVAAVTVNAVLLEDAAAVLRVPKTAVPEVCPRQGPDP